MARPLALAVLLAGLAGLGAFALHRRESAAAQVAGVAALYLLANATPAARAWPLPNLVLLLVHGALVRGAALGPSPWVRGGLDRGSLAAIAGFSALAAAALVAWRYGAGADLERYRAFVPALPAALIFAGILPYAMFNAIFEELIWRGVFWRGVEQALGGGAAWALTSLSFGLAHWLGFPSGWPGVGLATVYGGMMGWIRRRSGGLLAPWLAHVVADVVIYGMVAAFVLG